MIVRLLNFLFVVLLLLPTVSQAQQKITINGKIQNSQGQAVTDGDVFLLSKTDSTIIKYGIVTEGRFKLGPVDSGTYLLKVSSIGFEVYFQTLSLTENAELSIQLGEKAAMLKDVTVLAAKKTFVNKNGNFSINIENTVFSEISNAVDLLSKFPTIQVASDGNSIDIVGRGFALVFVDNQRITISELNALSVRDIKDIQIINNPSAKYDANGRAVILITRKTNRKEGFQVDIFEAASFKRFNNFRQGTNLNLKLKKIEIKANFQYNHLKVWEKQTYDFRIPAEDIVSSYELRSNIKKPEYIAGVGAYYPINEGDYISFNANTRIQNISFPIYTNTYFRHQLDENLVTTTNLSDYPKRNYNTYLNYNKKLKKINGSFFLGGQYSRYNEELSSNIYDQLNGSAQPALSQTRHQQYHVDVFTGKADFERGFKNEMRLEMGAAISNAKARAIMDVNNYNPPETSYTDYGYREVNTAGYVQMRGKIGKSGFMAGVRMENTNVDGGFKGDALLIDRNYTQFFPRITVDLPVDSLMTLSVNYARNINRPNYSILSQATAYINPYFEWANNINLNPSTTDDVFVNFQWKDRSFRLGYSRTKGPANPSFQYYADKLLLRRMDVNFESESAINFTAFVPTGYRIWTSTNVLSATFSRIKNPAAVVFDAKPIVYLYTRNQFNLPKDFVIFTTAWWVSRRNDGIFKKTSLSSVDLGFTKTLFKKLTCMVSFNDMFRTMGAEEAFIINNIQSVGYYYEDVREFTISLRYSFGKLKDSKYKSKEVNENSGRVR
jgi:hypothetical protein